MERPNLFDIVNYKRIFTFRIKRQAKRVFPSDVKKSINSDNIRIL